jgi:hypothetical protein
VKKKKLVYICSPYKGDTETNTQNALYYCAAAFAAGYIPIAPHVYFTRFTDDNNRKERAEGLAAGKQLLLLCSEVWVFGLDKPSKGMREEIALAIRSGIRVFDGELKTRTKASADQALLPAYKDLIVSTFGPFVETIATAFAPVADALNAVNLKLPQQESKG